MTYTNLDKTANILPYSKPHQFLCTCVQLESCGSRASNDQQITMNETSKSTYQWSIQIIVAEEIQSDFCAIPHRHSSMIDSQVSRAIWKHIVPENGISPARLDQESLPTLSSAEFAAVSSGRHPLNVREECFSAVTVILKVSKSTAQTIVGTVWRVGNPGLVPCMRIPIDMESDSVVVLIFDKADGLSVNVLNIPQERFDSSG